MKEKDFLLYENVQNLTPFRGEQKMKKLRIVLVVLAVFFVATACNGGSNENVQPTRPPVSNLRWQDFKAEAQQCYTRLTGCEPGEENSIYLSHVGERVHWTNNVSYNEGNTLVLFNSQFAIALLNVPSETINKLRVGTEVTVEGTIVSHSKYVWALDDVIILDIEPEPTSRVYPTALSPHDYNVEIDFVSIDEVRGDYTVTYNVRNNGNIEVKVCVTAFGRFKNPDHYNDTRIISNIGGNHGSCAVTLPPGENTLVQIDTKASVEENDSEEFTQLCGLVWTYDKYSRSNQGFDKLAEWKLNDAMDCRY